MPAPSFLKKLFANPSGENFVIAFRNIPLLNRIAIACMPRHTDYKKDSLRNVVRKKIHFQLDLSDWVDWNIFFDNEVEPKENLFRQIKSVMFVFDIGANMGETSLTMAKQVGVTGEVFSFEPSPVNFKKCLHNISLNKNLKNRIKLFNLALGENEGTALLQTRDEHNFGMNTISVTGTEVKMKTLDLFFQEEKIPQCNLIKMDVEGFELKILKGAESTLKKFKPVLFLELNQELLQQQGDSVSSLFSFLNKHQYKIIDPQLSEEEFSNGHYDIIAV